MSLRRQRAANLNNVTLAVKDPDNFWYIVATCRRKTTGESLQEKRLLMDKKAGPVNSSLEGCKSQGEKT